MLLPLACLKRYFLKDLQSLSEFVEHYQSLSQPKFDEGIFQSYVHLNLVVLVLAYNRTQIVRKELRRSRFQSLMSFVYRYSSVQISQSFNTWQMFWSKVGTTKILTVCFFFLLISSVLCKNIRILLVQAFIGNSQSMYWMNVQSFMTILEPDFIRSVGDFTSQFTCIPYSECNSQMQALPLFYHFLSYIT